MSKQLYDHLPLLISHMARASEALNGKHSEIELPEKGVQGTERRTGVLVYATTPVRTVGAKDGHT